MQTPRNDYQQSPTKNKDRVSSNTACSDDFYELSDNIILFQTEFLFKPNAYAKRFNSLTIQNQIGSKLNVKAVQWLISLCWDQNMDHQGLWLSVGLFYIYCSRKQIKKTQLELILSSVILISTKLTKSQNDSAQKIMQLTKLKFSVSDIIRMQSQILEAVGFDVHFQHLLADISLYQNIDSDLKTQFFCVAQFFLLKNAQIFWNNMLCLDILKILKNGQKQTSEKAQTIKNEIRKIAKSKEGNIILRKYDSFIDTHELLLKLQQ